MSGGDAEFVARMSKLANPAVVGVPVTAPLLELRESPAGKDPVGIDHVIGVVPVAAKVCE